MINMSQIDSHEMWIDSAKMFNIVCLIQKCIQHPKCDKIENGSCILTLGCVAFFLEKIKNQEIAQENVHKRFTLLILRIVKYWEFRDYLNNKAFIKIILTFLK